MSGAAGYEYIRCRPGGIRHGWMDHDGSGFRRPSFGVANHYECIRCGTVRRDIVSRVDGALLSRRYYYPVGYKLAGDEQPSVEAIRLNEIKAQRQSKRKGAVLSTERAVVPKKVRSVR